MARFGLDWAWGWPGVPALKTAGVTFVCRYVSTEGNSKNLRASEAKMLQAGGIDIVVVFETTANRALAGYTAGRLDAISAERQAVACGAPADAPVYFAVDFDATLTAQASVNKYLTGAASVLGVNRVGVYGGYWVVKRALDAKVCKYAWQTYAWSGGAIDARAHLYQYSNGHRLNGVSVDYNRALKDDFGQWGGAKVISGPVDSGGAPQTGDGDKPLPGPLKKPPWFWAALSEFLKRGKYKSGV